MGTTVDRDWLVNQLDHYFEPELLPVSIGVDIGQVHDPSAICVTEIAQVDTGKVRYTGKQTLGHHDEYGNWIKPTGQEPVMRSEYTVKQIRRLPLNTSYPDVAEHLADMLGKDVFKNRKVRLLIDVTGVGRPVYDALKLEMLLRLNNAEITFHGVGVQFKMSERHMLQLKPISFVHGEIYNRSRGTLGKAFLVSRLQTLFQWRRFHAPDTKEVKAMIEELLVYEIKVNDKGTDTYGAFKTGAHDDLATAAGLSALEDPYKDKVTYSERVY